MQVPVIPLEGPLKIGPPPELPPTPPIVLSAARRHKQRRVEMPKSGVFQLLLPTVAHSCRGLLESGLCCAGSGKSMESPGMPGVRLRLECIERQRESAPQHFPARPRANCRGTTPPPTTTPCPPDIAQRLQLEESAGTGPAARGSSTAWVHRLQMT